MFDVYSSKSMLRVWSRFWQWWKIFLETLMGSPSPSIRFYPLFLDTYSSPCVVSLCFDERISGIWINVQGLLLFFF